MSPWTLYLITRLDTFVTMSVVVLVIGGLAILAALILTCFGGDTIRDSMRWSREDVKASEDAKASGEQIMKYGRRCWTAAIPVLVLGVLGLTFIPTTKEAAVIYVLPKVANNEQLQAEAGELYGLAKEYLKRQVADDGPEKR